MAHIRYVMTNKHFWHDDIIMCQVFIGHRFSNDEASIVGNPYDWSYISIYLHACTEYKWFAWTLYEIMLNFIAIYNVPLFTLYIHEYLIFNISVY